MPRLLIAVLFVLLAIPSAANVALTVAEVDAFAARVEKFAPDSGMALVVVKGGRVLMVRSYGVADPGKGTPVTADTRFYIASSTKSFTAAAVGLLAHEGKLDLDAPMTRTLPGLELTPPLDANRVSLRDFITHRAGITSGAVNFRTAMFGNMSDEEIVANFKRFTDSAPVGFRYSNVGYVLAGLALERATGTSWQEVLGARVFEPLQMTATTAVVAGLEGKPVALPWRRGSDGSFTLRLVKTDATMIPAGGIFTTAPDLGRWLLAQLGEGQVDGQQVFPRAVVRQLHAPQVNLAATWGPVKRYAYALGWYHGDYDGDLLVHHYGGFNGAYAHVSFMPEHDLGVAVVSTGGGDAPETLAYWIYDRLRGKPDLAAKYDAVIERLVKENAGKATATAAAATTLAERSRSAVMTHEAAAYAGLYHSDRMGDIEVRVRDGALRAMAGVIDTPLLPSGGDDFVVDWSGDGGSDKITFLFDRADRAVTLDWGGRKFERK